MGTVNGWNELAAQLGVDSIRSSTAAGSGHPTSSLSAAHLVAVLWSGHLRYDVADPKSLANRLGDKRYRAMAEAFGFTSGATRPAALADEIVERHVSAELERRVGTIDGNLRIAMNAERELAKIGRSTTSDNTRWYGILGSPPLRKVVEGAFGLGTVFGKLPLDRQLSELKERCGKMFGSPSPDVFAAPANVEKLIQRFLVRAQAVSPAQSSYNAALVLLSN